MRYDFGAVFSASVPKLIGTYERELHATIDALAEQPWATIVDVGAAEGYYAVGLALRVSGGRVIAFEEDPVGRELFHANVQRNAQANRIEVRGKCTGSVLASVLRDAARPSLAILDVEGAEVELLSAVDHADLGRTTLVVEVHDFCTPAGQELISLQLDALLRGTHNIQKILSERRHERDFPRAFWFVPPRNRLHAMDEYRPETMSWFVCRPLEATR